jgi:hypothetical protein
MPSLLAAPRVTCADEHVDDGHGVCCRCGFVAPPLLEWDREAREERVAPALGIDAIAEKCRRNLHYYVKEQWRRARKSVPLEDGPHIRAICDHIQGQLEDAAAKRGVLHDLARARTRLEWAQGRQDPELVEGVLAEISLLEAEESGCVLRAQNLLINCPPRSLKTLLLTLANAWAWIRWPYLQILYLSANPDVVLQSARLFRDVVASAWYQSAFVPAGPDGKPSWVWREDQDALGNMGNSAGGARRAKGWGAKIIGLDSDWVCLDDAHGSRDSSDVMAAAIEKYDGEISTRSNDPRCGIRTAIMQRMGRLDFSAHVLQSGWLHLCMPMEYELRRECPCRTCQDANRGIPDPFGYIDWRSRAGDVLHPRFTREHLAERLRTLKAHGYAGQMQQRPTVRGGDIFRVEGWRYFLVEGTPPQNVGPDGRAMRPDGAHQGAPFTVRRDKAGRLEVDWVCLSVDPTGASTNPDASQLGITLQLGLGERRLILEDMTPGVCSWKQTKARLRAAIVRTSDLTGWTRKILVLVEKKALGPSAIEEIEEWIGDGLKNSRSEVIHAKVEPYEPSGKGDKEQRADPLETLQEDGLLYLLDGADWLLRPPTIECEGTLVEEFAAFPRGRDDRVDTVSQCTDRHRSGAVPDWVRLFSAKASEERGPLPSLKPSRPFCSACQGLPAPCASCAQSRCAHQIVDGKCVKCGGG